MQFEGEFKAGKINRFLQQFKDGQKCSKMFRLDENSDFSAMSVSQLKDILKDRGESCLECTEKLDYVKKLRGLIMPGLKTEL